MDDLIDVFEIYCKAKKELEFAQENYHGDAFYYHYSTEVDKLENLKLELKNQFKAAVKEVYCDGEK